MPPLVLILELVSTIFTLFYSIFLYYLLVASMESYETNHCRKVSTTPTPHENKTKTSQLFDLRLHCTCGFSHTGLLPSIHEVIAEKLDQNFPRMFSRYSILLS